MLKPVALGVPALLLCFCVGSADAAALASASLNIVKFTWYVLEGDEPDVETDPTVTTGFFGSTADTSLLSGNDVGTLEITRPAIPPPDNTMAGAANLTADSLKVGPLCAGAGCPAPSDFCVGNGCQNPPGFAPIDAFNPTDQFVNGILERNGFFMIQQNDPGANSNLSAGVRADVSLPGPGDSEGSITSEWVSLSSMRAQRAFQSYFEVEFQAQSLAHQSSDAFESAAESSISLQVVLEGGNRRAEWNILDLAAEAIVAGDPDDVYTDNIFVDCDIPEGTSRPATCDSAPGQDPAYRIYYNSFYEFGAFDIAANTSYKIDIVATAIATASTTKRPSVVPVLPVTWLILPGLVWLLVSVRLFGQPSRKSDAASLAI